MKKYIFMAVAGMLALSSCSNDDDIVADNTPHAMTFTAGYGDDNVVSRATISSDKKVTFEANDNISILSAKNSNTKFTTSAGGSSADFTGTAVNDSKFYAVYPYTEGLTLDGTTIKGVVIPATQFNSTWNPVPSPVKETWTWDPKAPIALAVADAGSALKFKNLCAIVMLNVTTTSTDYARQYYITISADQSLAGTFNLDTTTRALTATSGNTTVIVPMLTVPTDNGKRHVYIAIAPGNYTNFNLKILKSSTYVFDKTKSSVTFEAGKIYNIADYSE